MSTWIVHPRMVDDLKPFLALYEPDRGVATSRHQQRGETFIPSTHHVVMKGWQSWRNILPFNTSRCDDHALTYLGFLQVTTMNVAKDFEALAKRV